MGKVSTCVGAHHPSLNTRRRRRRPSLAVESRLRAGSVVSDWPSASSGPRLEHEAGASRAAIGDVPDVSAVGRENAPERAGSDSAMPLVGEPFAPGDYVFIDRMNKIRLDV